MHKSRCPSLAAVLVLALAFAAAAQAQLTLPPNGDNQHSVVSQGIGLVTITVDYNSPNVHAPDGSDRRGKIWGELVPWGMANLGFGTCGDQCPWRGGANENTVFTTTHDIEVQGQPLRAGSYGLHFLPGAEEWTVIFSNNSTSWGSFTYDVKEDALRVSAKPEKATYHEWLSYEFTDRQPDRATLALVWEDLALPLEIRVNNTRELYLASLRRELRNFKGFTWENWQAAADYALAGPGSHAEALVWAQNAVAFPGIGRENVTTLMTLARAQEANGLATEAAATLQQAANHPTAGPLDLHFAGRQLLTAKKPQDALKIFLLNAQRHPKQWPVEVGLARGYSAVGNYKEALKHARLAAAQAPDPGNKAAMERAILLLEEGKDIN
jgi:tetratricopeptide (TPR) repeat protein